MIQACVGFKKGTKVQRIAKTSTDEREQDEMEEQRRKEKTKRSHYGGKKGH